MSSSPARMKMIQSKMKGLEWSQHFSHYKSMEIFPEGKAISQPVFRYGFWGTVFCVINFTCFRSNAWTTSLYDLFRKD